MTRTFTARLCGLASGLLLLGCNSGPMGPNTTYRSVPASRTVSPTSRAPIANQPLNGGTASSVQVLPFATLPPHAAMQAQNGVRPLAVLASNGQMIDGRPLPLMDGISSVPRDGGARSRSLTTRLAAATGPQAGALANGLPPTPQEDLRYRGGRVIQNLTFANIYVGGQSAWDPQDWKSIDKALAASMSDEYLNNVIRQYFNNQPLGNTFKGSFFLSGWKPTFVSKSDLERQVSGLYSGGAFNGLDLPNTVFNFMLPRGTLLGDPSAGMQEAPVSNKAIPHEEAEDSSGGLGGYHGSIHSGNVTVYYAVGVYSERLPNGGTNGIPVFDQNWKNVVATFYHELQEARTDPDVGDAVAGRGPDPSRWLGWTSDSGLEIGDYPIAEAKSLSQVFIEVPLADGSGTVPIQLQYSNAVHGPEGPIVDLNTRKPFTGQPSSPGGTTPSNPPTNNPPPATTDPDLAKLVASWNQLEDFVKKAIIRLAASR